MRKIEIAKIGVAHRACAEYLYAAPADAPDEGRLYTIQLSPNRQYGLGISGGTPNLAVYVNSLGAVIAAWELSSLPILLWWRTIRRYGLQSQAQLSQPYG